MMITNQLVNFQLDDETVEVVDNFTFLGSMINESSDCSQEIRRRLMIGRTMVLYTPQDLERQGHDNASKETAG